jgi:RNA recognition motif-containing protein
MNANLYVGNLPQDINEEELQTLFNQFGKVKSIKLISDHQTGAFRGFAFVEMSSQEEADLAKDKLQGYTIDDREIKVNDARRRKTRPNSNFRGNRNNYSYNNRR